MATSDNHGLPKRRNESAIFLEALTRYDLVLAIIPVVFLLGLLVGHLLSIPTRTALSGAAAVGVLTVGDALFVNPPKSSQ